MKKNPVKIKEKLLISEIRYRRLFETAHDGILIINSQNGQIEDVNPFLMKMLGYSKQEFLRKKLWEVGAFGNIKASRDAFEILQNQGFIRYDHLPLETKDGRLVEVEFVANSYMAGDKLVIQCNIRDITERNQILALQESKRLFNEERLKVESIADATHELRTPISIIKGNVDLALNIKGKNKKNPMSALRAINHEVRYLSNILSDLSLITSKMWETKSKIMYKDIDLKSLIESSIKRSRVLAYSKKISLIVKKIPNIIISGDKEYLEKMLINLIKNSIIYGKKNGHTIVEAKRSKKFVVISVIDNGIGITKEDVQHVFERFYRVNKFNNNNSNSVGLGLAIVKWIAEVHGGKVDVKSFPDKGSTFTVSLPIKKLNY